jgi:hypothetical protein
MNRWRFALIPMLLLAASTAEAQITRFYAEDNDGSEGTRASNVNSLARRTQFLSSLIGAGTETFEGKSGSAPLVLTFPGAGTATLSGTGQVVSQGAGTNGFGRYPISGSNFWEAVLTRSGTFTVAFNQKVAAFGFYAMDLGDFGSNLTLEFRNEGTLIDTWTPYTTSATSCSNPYCGSIKYVGTINTATFDEVKFVGSDADDYFAFDDMTVGSLEQVSVPEPASVSLLAVGLAGLVAARRRRQRAD